MHRITVLCALLLTTSSSSAQDLTPGFDYIGTSPADTELTNTYNCSSVAGSPDFWIAAQRWKPPVVTIPSELWTVYSDRGLAPSGVNFTVNIHSGLTSFTGNTRVGDVLHLPDVTPNLGDVHHSINVSVDGSPNYVIGFTLPPGVQLDSDHEYLLSWFAETTAMQVDGPAAVAMARIPGPLGYEAWSFGNPGNMTLFQSVPYAGGPPFPGNFAMKLVGTTEDPSVPFCFGDGSTGPDCPCGNNSLAGDGEGCRNSTGSGAVLFASGSASVANDDLRLHVHQGRPGMFAALLQGSQTISMPFRDGVFCMGNPTQRVEYLFLDEHGFDSSSVSIAAGDSSIAPGTTTYYQVWYHDAPHGACSSQSNWSNGVSVSWN